MTISWIDDKHHSVFQMLEQAGHQFEPSPLPTDDSPPVEYQQPIIDEVLEQSYAQMHESWSVDMWQVVKCQEGMLGYTLTRLQHAVRHLTWWYLQPQCERISQFQGAVVRTSDSLLAQIRHLSQRLDEETTAHTTQLRATDEQLQRALQEQQALIRRVTELEQQVALLRLKQNLPTSQPTTEEPVTETATS